MLSYVYACPYCHGVNSLDHSDLRPVHPEVQEELLGAEWQCSRCKGLARIRVAGSQFQLTVEKGAAPGGADVRADKGVIGKAGRGVMLRRRF